MDDPTFSPVPAAGEAVGLRLRVTPPAGGGDPWSRSAALPEPGAWEDAAAVLLDRAREEGAIQPAARVRLEWLDADGRPVGSRQKTIPGEAPAPAAAAAELATGAAGAELDTFGAALAAGAAAGPGGPVVPLAAVAAMGAAMGQLAGLVTALAAENTRATRAALDAATAQGAELRRLAGQAVEGATAAHQLAIGQALEAGEHRAAAAAAAERERAAGEGGGGGEEAPIVAGLQAAAELVKGGSELVGQLSGKRPATAETVGRILRGVLARPEADRGKLVGEALAQLTEEERGQLAATLVGAMGSGA